jgi:hypothetical protein
MKKIKKYGRIVPIDVRVYSMTQVPETRLGDVPYEITETKHKGKADYNVTDNGKFVHRISLYDGLYVLKLIGKQGPSFGDAVTAIEYRGQGVYPKMMQNISIDQLQKGEKEVFLVVNSVNAISIRGIDKAGFELRATIKAKRFLWIYFNKEIKYF